MGIYMFGLRSFGAIGNYAVMDSKSPQALDLMLKEVRQASKVVGFQTNGTTRWLSVAATNSPAATNTFTWDSTTGIGSGSFNINTTAVCSWTAATSNS